MSADLFEAIDQHDLHRVAELIAQGVNPNIFESEWPRYTPLQIAIGELEFGGPLDIVRILLEHGADINAWDASHDSTPLLVAVCRRQFDIVPMLLADGADPNVRSGEGDSPLRMLVEEKEYELVELLLRYDARKTINEVGEPGGLSALGIAAQTLNISMVELLLKNGADPNILDEYLSPAHIILPSRKECDPQVWNTVMKLLKSESR